MRAIIRFIRKRWFLNLLGLTLVSIIIWFIGPLIAFAGQTPLETINNRIIAIVLIFGAWFLNWLIRHLWAQTKNKELIAAILGQKAETAVDNEVKEAEREVELLEKNIQQAVDVLKKEKKAKYSSNQFLYKLPWYLLIGPPGSGKTTALTTSDLHILITDKHGRGRELPGVHGTRYCDWLFTDEAVLVDTAGRYTTQDSRPEVDSAAWIGFLGLLKQYRKRRPINGVVVCVSLPQIADQPIEKTQADADDIRLRLRELHEHLKIRFPIYMVFTKCDLLEGFTQFFGDLSKEGRQQVWGATFPLENSTKNLLEQFDADFEQLEARLNKRIITRLQQENDPKRRAMIYAFPKQFGALRELAKQFIDETFLATRYETPVMLRGVYFTSGAQQGSPLDRLMGSLARSFGLLQTPQSTVSSSSKSYFLTRLFRHLIFTEAGLANTDLHWENRRLWIQRGLIGFSALFVGLLILGWFASYIHNKGYLQHISEHSQSVQLQIDNLPSYNKQLRDVLPILNAIRVTPDGYTDKTNILHTVSQLGLDQQAEFDSKSKIVYQRLLKSLYLPRLIIRIEDRLRDPHLSTKEMLEILRIYIMLDDPINFNRDSVIAWLKDDLKREGIRDGEHLQQNVKLVQHAAAMFADGPVKPPFELDKNLIAKVRNSLGGITIADRVYSLLINDRSIWRGVEDFRAIDEVGHNFYAVFAGKTKMFTDATIDKRYTNKGFMRFRDNIAYAIDNIGKDSWVLEKPDSTTVQTEKLHAQVSSRYFQEFIQSWFSFLNELTIVSFDDDLYKAVDVLRIITGEDSPFEKLLAAVKRETTLQNSEKYVDTVLKEDGWGITGSANALKDKVVKLFDNSFSPHLQEQSVNMDVTSVQAAFGDIHKLARVKEGSIAPIHETLSHLAKFERYLSTLLDMRKQAMVDQILAIQDSELSRFRRYAEIQREPVAQWLSVIDRQVSSAISNRALSYLNAEWQASVWDLYRDRLQGRYPLATASRKEVALADFGEFFGPEGAVHQFFNDYLKDLIDTRRNYWRLESNSPIHISRETLIALQQADRIRKTFFYSRGEKSPSVSFTLSPISMDMSIDQFHLNLDGQTLSYDHSATRPQDLQWPGPGSGLVQILINPPPTTASRGITIKGAWAWFRMLDSAIVKKSSDAGIYDITFKIGEKQVIYEMRTHSVNNPFRAGSLKAFRCPELL